MQPAGAWGAGSFEMAQIDSNSREQLIPGVWLRLGVWSSVYGQRNPWAATGSHLVSVPILAPSLVENRTINYARNAT